MISIICCVGKAVTGKYTKSGTGTSLSSTTGLALLHVHIGLGGLHHGVVLHHGAHHVVGGGHGGAEEESGDSGELHDCGVVEGVWCLMS